MKSLAIKTVVLICTLFLISSLFHHQQGETTSSAAPYLNIYREDNKKRSTPVTIVMSDSNAEKPGVLRPTTTAEMKEELRTLFGVTDFSDCLEQEDLRQKLQRAHEALPITHGLQYGPLLTVGNTVNPSGIVTLAHGLGDSASGWEDVAEDLARRLPHLLFLLPTAPKRAVTINGGSRMNAWYDILNMISGGLTSGVQDGVGVRQSAEYVHTLASTTARKHGVPLERIVYSGFSQGAAVSLAAGLIAPQAPAGVAVLSGYLAGGPVIAEAVRNRAFPIAVFHGRQDPIVPFAAAKETKKVLEEKMGVQPPVEFHEYNMQHSATPEEITDVEAFLRRVLP